MKLLIVDDHELNLKLLRAQLEGEGHEVVEAQDGVAALEALARAPVDGVVSDILMPRMDGYRLCMEVRARPGTARLPFILYTSTYNSQGDRQLAESIGADAYIAKPAPVSRIVAAVLAAADKARSADRPRVAPAAAVPEPLMQQYNAVLIRKLEEKGEELERTHEGLLESQARLSGLIASAMDAIIAVDESRRIMLFNAAAGRMFRIDPDAAIGRPLNDFIPFRSRDLHNRHMAAFATEETEGRPMGPREVHALRADGTEFPIEANISRMPTSNGQLFTVFIRDVTERRRAQAALRESEAGLRRAQDIARMAHAIVRSDGSFQSWSPSFSGLLGVPADRLPRNREDFLDLVHEDDRAVLQVAAEAARTTGQRGDCEYRLRRGGEWRRVRHILEPLEEDGAGHGSGLVFSTLQDVTAQHQAQEKIRQLNHVYAVLSGINALIVRATDRDQLFQQACRLLVETGHFAKAWIGMVDEGIAPIRILAWAGAEDAFFEDLQRRLAGPDGPGLLARTLAGRQPVVSNDIANDPAVVQRARLVETGSLSFALLPLVVEGRTVGVLSIHSPIVAFFDEQETELLLGLAGDISFALDRLLKADRLSYLATHDVLTGLPNRTLYLELLGQQLGESARSGHLACVALLDLVRFRRVNETLGREAGDELLRQIAQRLHAVDPFAARLGADLFALQFNERHSAVELARDFEHAAASCFGRPYLVAGEELRIGCRIGAAVFPGDGGDPESLLRNAESALRRARTAATDFVFYAPGMNASANESLALETRLRRAIEHGELVLHYQPKYCLSDRRICGVEALLRWQDPEHGLVPPMRFVPLLEEIGLIGPVGRWALARALEDARGWRDAGAPAVRVAVNVSPVQLNQPDFAASLAGLLQPGDGELLELEITESVIMEDVDHKVAMLAQVRALGVSVAVDDFGTGYSSLAYISRLPITALKIDRSFVTGMTVDPDGYTLVSSIIALAHALGLKVVAEGVETEEQAGMLALLNCEEAQGYLFSKAVPAADCLALLQASAARTHRA